VRRNPVPDVPQCEPRDGIECRYGDDVRYPDRKPRLDEVIGKEVTVHLAHMNDSDWWLLIEGENGARLVVNIYAERANVYAFAEWDS
jgi:hypothetical protein